ncbi:unnamed protein product [Cuscuta epithymum]|uniref:BHLH domain-containing protein n=1 Tax=Cuscuta epithymum TaxID=186058 RepID=A0AAV0CBW5_9ASTE|nr:unnamed protein product [Cuscuta epithymum]
MSHIGVERKRRRQMNDQLNILRSLTPSSYIQRGDQASIVGGVIEFIKELHQVQQSMEAKKRRIHSLSPDRPPLQPITPTQHLETSSSSNCMMDVNTNSGCEFNEVGACCNSPVADVEARISGSNVILKTISRRVRGQILTIINVLETFSFEILQLNISSIDDTVLYTFVIKIGLECQISVEELALEVQHCFCSNNAAPLVDTCMKEKERKPS